VSPPKILDLAVTKAVQRARTDRPELSLGELVAELGHAKLDAHDDGPNRRTRLL